jgi:putative transposase
MEFIMVQYRRNYQTDGLYFFTVTLKNRSATLLTDYINLLKQAFQRVKKEHPYKIKAIVVLPDHLHTIWEMCGIDQNYSLRWRKIKSYFTRSLYKIGVVTEKNKRGGFNVWQSRFWEHTIRDESDFENHVNYIHYNPVKHELVTSVKDWPYSSFHRYVKQKIFDQNWGDTYENSNGSYGE